MHELIPWAGFLGAWLLVAGPVRQAVIELRGEELELDRLHQTMASVPAPAPVSPWWWLVPPVGWVLRHRRREQHQADIVEALSSEDREALRSFIAKARAWFIVGVGGLLIAVKETGELAEHHEWHAWVFWALLPLMLMASLGLAAAESVNEAREK